MQEALTSRAVEDRAIGTHGEIGTTSSPATGMPSCQSLQRARKGLWAKSRSRSRSRWVGANAGQSLQGYARSS